MGKTETRNYGIDLMRIVSMFMVVIIHLTGLSGMLNEAVSLNRYILHIIYAAVICAVNCYALISGYVGVCAEFKLRRIVNLWFQVAFYSVLITGILYFIQPEGVTITLTDLIKSFFPVASREYWYFTSYFGLFFFMPLLNNLINNTAEKTLRRFVIAVLLLYCAYSRVFASDIFNLGLGYSMIWLIILYIIGGYMRKYEIVEKIKNSAALIAYIISTLLTAAAILIRGVNNTGWIYYISPFVLIQAIGLITVFAKLKINNKKLIGFIGLFSPLAFGVYLIHINERLFACFVKYLVTGYASLPTAVMLGKVAVTAVLLYICCSLIDLVRMKLFTAIHIDTFGRKIESTVYALLNKFSL